MRLSGREAAEALGVLGVDRASARRALLAGIAGTPERTRGALLYDAERVQDAVVRGAEEIDPDRIATPCRHGTFVARRSTCDVAAPRDQQLEAARRWWFLSAYTRLEIRLRIAREGFVPFVATVSGFVVLGADIAAVYAEAAGSGRRTPRCEFELHEPGAWFGGWQGRRLATGPGGPWRMWTPGDDQRRLDFST